MNTREVHRIYTAKRLHSLSISRMMALCSFRADVHENGKPAVTTVVTVESFSYFLLRWLCRFSGRLGFRFRCRKLCVGCRDDTIFW
jgi:hypothetical protein